MSGAAVGLLDDEEEKDSSKQHVTFRAEPALIERMERAKKATGWSRTKLIEKLLEHGLEALEAELAATRKLKKQQ